MENYILESELGSGIEGVTYKGLDLTNQREVAIKIVKIENLPAGINWRAIYERETFSLKKLSGSPYTPKLYDSFITDDGFVIVMELIKGDNVYDLIFSPENIELSWILIGKILEAYSYIRNIGFEHRDLTPQNLIWTGDRIVFVDLANACYFPTEKCELGFDDIDTIKYVVEQLIGNINSWDEYRKYKLSRLLEAQTLEDMILAYNE